MEPSDYTTNDFLEDAQFRRWVRQPNAELDTFWQNFLEKYPEKKPEVIAATNFLLGIEQQVEGGASAAVHEEVVFQRIQQIIANESKVPVWRQLPRRTSWAAAASLLLILGYFALPVDTQKISYESNRGQTTLTLIEKINDTDEPLFITLTDGSTISLQPRSRISYAHNFNKTTKREVHLSGEAFFEVAKDPNKPFYVFANELVTKVLGTSFNVRAYQDDEDITVEVRTGRVSVAVADQLGKQNMISTREREGILLLPNQQAVLARKEIRL
ncbi:FecR family protein, partial [Persicitalea sp.]|uniref:FecR family protein n=1 Tax=Persicitalea sp. TaxID=3100273 RepID=UPI003594464C